MKLNQLKPGELVRIIAVEGGLGLRQKLSSKGIAVGSVVRVISRFGPITFEVDRKIFSIGRKLAEKIRVKYNATKYIKIFGVTK